MQIKHLTLGLQTKIALLCFGPALAICLIFSFFFIHARIDDVQETIQQEGSNITLHLSSKIHIALAEKEYELIEPVLAQAKLKYPIIKKISVIDDQGNLLGGSPSPFSIQELNTNFKLSKNTPSEVDFIEDNQNFYFIMQIADIEGPHRHLGFFVLTIPTNVTAELERQAIFTTIILTLITLLLCIFLATLLGRYIAKPMILMINAAKKVQKGHYEDAFLNFKSFSEFELLKDTWNKMAKSVDRSIQIMQEKIKEATKKLEINNDELNQARLKALEGEKAKAEFLANMSHEIRTPLNAILGFTDLILDDHLTENQEEHLLIVKKSAQSLLKILNDILDFSKIEAGKLKIIQESFSLKIFLEEILTLFASQAQQKRLYLWLQIYPDVPELIHTDPFRLKQILMNLIGNALKFTHQGYILIKASLDPKTSDLRIEITDTGIGLSPLDQTKLFQAFSQADTSATKQYGGTGLGLIICKKLMLLLGGEIGLISKPNQGSTFWIELPQNEKLSDSSADMDSPLKAKSSDLLFKSLRVLVEESSQVGRLSFLQHLESIGVHQITLCKSSEELISNLLTASPDIFMLSSDTAEEISKDPKWKQTFTHLKKISKTEHSLPGIVFGPEPSSNLHQTAKKLSLSAELSIPYTQDQLKAAFSKAIGIKPHPRKPRLSNKKESSLTLSSPNLSSLNLSSLNVLVVDDHENNLQLLVTILEKFGIKAHGASSGQKAIDWVKAHPTDVIFMDIQMPDMDGFTATQKIRELPTNQSNKKPNNQGIKIFALTADISESQQSRIQTSGMDGYYLKPISYEDLTQILINAASNHPSKKVPSALLQDNNNVKNQQLSDITELQIQQLPEISRAIKQALEKLNFDQDVDQNQNREELLQIIHKFHGGLCYTTLSELKEAAKHAEQSLKASTWDAKKSQELIQDLLRKIAEPASLGR
jgi:two-component system sensor histidine kinase BarA